ncbi:MAG: cation transporter [Methylococcaceae bacterium]|nr:cation transporter [Methylococcaceae bacterium]MCI0668800.1 cation transporter [Methylococcaceae bacterium]MCI0733111.1 cation transporter [Methylococcaceae bacterium]
MSILLKRLLVVLLFSGHFVLVGAAEPDSISAKSLKTVTLDVRKMDCPMCKITIRKALEKVDGVKEARVDYDTKTARVTFDPAATSVDALTRATADAGYPSTLKPE